MNQCNITLVFYCYITLVYIPTISNLTIIKGRIMSNPDKIEVFDEFVAKQAICYVYAFDVEDLTHVYHGSGLKPKTYKELYGKIMETGNSNLYLIENDDVELIGDSDYSIDIVAEHEDYPITALDSYYTFAYGIFDRFVKD